MRALVLLLTVLLAVPVAAVSPAGPGREVITLWPGPAPGSQGATAREEIVERSKTPEVIRDRYIKGVVTPTLIVFKPARPTGASLLMIPGGGYKWVVMDKEGYEAAERFAAAGVTVYVLAHRLPGDHWGAGPAAALQDAQRAMRLIRARTTGPVGVIGFSAGGHVAGTLMQKWDRPVYEPMDAADRRSARPDFAVLMYPVASMHADIAHVGSRTELLGASPTAEQEKEWSLEDCVRPDEPPVLLIHAIDDTSVPVENSLRLLAALRAAKIPVEAHVFEEGGHGFGIRYVVGKPAAIWPDLVLGWMRRKGWAA
ncbi:MAG: dienelactone hydrolase [Caulobacter sp.]|nr:dienelactone hydrolase [Caulobacter sp.]